MKGFQQPWDIASIFSDVGLPALGNLCFHEGKIL